MPFDADAPPSPASSPRRSLAYSMCAAEDEEEAGGSPLRGAVLLPGAQQPAVLLRRAAAETMGEIAGLQGGMDALQETIQGHARGLATYKEQLRAKEDECRALERENRALAAAAQRREAEAGDAEGRARALAAEQQRRGGDVARLEETLAARDARAGELLAKTEALEHALAEAHRHAAAGDADAADLRRRLLAAEAAAEAAKGRAAAQAQQAALFESQLSEAGEARAELERRVASLTQADADARARAKRKEAEDAATQDRLARYEATIAELREGQHEAARLRAALAEAQRQAHGAAAAKALTEQELSKAEDDLAAALRRAGDGEQAALDADVWRQKCDALTQKLAAAAAQQARLEEEHRTTQRARDALEVTVVEHRREVGRLEDERDHMAHRAAVYENENALREKDSAEASELREALVRSRQECEELAVGVERLHERAEADRRRWEAAARAGASPAETDALKRQLTQVAETLGRLWTELAPHAFPHLPPGAAPADGQLAALAATAGRLLRKAGGNAERVRGIAARYVGVLGDRARASAAAALAAPVTAADDTDDLEAAAHVLEMVLEKLLADVGSARALIEELTLRQQQQAARHERRSISPPYRS